MALSAFEDTSQPPDDRAIAQVLGTAHRLWKDLKDALQAAHGPLLEEWSHSGKGYGWSLRLKQKKRALVYMTPGHARFLASFALGERACRAAHESGLSQTVLDAIDAAPKYPEGRGVRLVVRRRQDVTAILQLAAIKAAH